MSTVTGWRDVIIGAPEADNANRTDSGSSYVVFGTPPYKPPPMTPPPTMPPAVTAAQTATVKVPKRITAKGATDAVEEGGGHQRRAEGHIEGDLVNEEVGERH